MCSIRSQQQHACIKKDSNDQPPSVETATPTERLPASACGMSCIPSLLVAASVRACCLLCVGMGMLLTRRQGFEGPEIGRPCRMHSPPSRLPRRTQPLMSSRGKGERKNTFLI